MSKKVLVISTSPRKGGNSDALADEFAKGALSAGHDAEKINLCDKNLKFCIGCLSCLDTKKCVIKDDANAIVEKMRTADIIAFATPIYYFEMSGQMKTMIDRSNPLYTSDYAFRDIYILSAAAENEDETEEGAVNGLKGWIACFEKARFAGSVFAGGVDKKGDIKVHNALKKAYDMGKGL